VGAVPRGVGRGLPAGGLRIAGPGVCASPPGAPVRVTTEGLESQATAAAAGAGRAATPASAAPQPPGGRP
jgi:hypothetical protein